MLGGELENISIAYPIIYVHQVHIATPETWLKMHFPSLEDNPSAVTPEQ